MRGIAVSVLLVALSVVETGCMWGYVTYFEPDLRAGREVPHTDPYTNPPPPSAVGLAGGTLSVGCPNIRKFALLPIPWFRRAFRPDELEIELGEDAALLDLRVALAAELEHVNALRLPDPDLANPEAAIDLELVEPTRLPDDLDRQVGSILVLADDVALVGFGARLLRLLLEGPRAVAGELDAPLHRVGLDQARDRLLDAFVIT